MLIKLTKAIEILTLNKTCDFEGDTRDLEAAHQLGIESMKREQLLRHEVPYNREGLLPGEQPEEIAKGG